MAHTTIATKPIAIGAKPGEAMAGGGAADCCLFHEALVGFHAGAARAVAEIQGFAKRAAIDLLVVEAPALGIGGNQAQREAGCGSERFLIHLESIRGDDSMKKRGFELLVG